MKDIKNAVIEVGDVVKSKTASGQHRKVGSEFVVLKIRPNNVRYLPRLSATSRQFEIVRKNTNGRGFCVGDIVELLNKPTIATIKVIEVMKDNFIKIIDDKGLLRAIKESEFKLIKRHNMEENSVNTTSSKQMFTLKIKEYSELQGMSTEKNGEDLLVAGIWWTPELEEIVSNQFRQIQAIKEDNYFVFNVDGVGDFMITEGVIAEVSGETTVTAGWTTSTVQSAKDTQKVPLESCPKVYKKPKAKKNSYPIEAQDLVLIDGLPVPSVVASVDGDDITIVGGNVFNYQDVFPLYPLDTRNPYEPKLGDVVRASMNEYKLLTKKSHLDEVKNLSLGGVFRHTDPNDKLIERKVLKKYSCGGLVDTQGNPVKKSALTSRFTPIVEEVEGSLEHEQIAKHYGITIDKVKPKEVKILQTLKVQLDHELSQKDSEWVLLVGPSGSGKTTVGVEYAESKGLDYVIQQGSAQLAVADLLGYKSIVKFDTQASNDDLYVPSLLRDAVENGKVFILDEIDACNPNTLLCLNALKLKEVQFPDKLVKVHPDFRFIATANTLIEDEDYNGRSAMDKATLSRFCIIFYDLSPAEIALRFGLENTKGLTINDKKAYSASEYNLLENCVLEPKTKLDPRNIQRIVRMRKIAKEGE